MNILADTHILIWALLGDEKLPLYARELILSSSNKIYYSMISVWEVALKRAAHKDKMNFSARSFDELCEKAGYNRLDGRAEHVFSLDEIKQKDDTPEHKDPFDRMLIAQAKYEKMMFLTHDAKMSLFDEECILVV